MHRFTALIALVIVVGAVSAMSASFSGTSLGVVTVLVAAGVLVYQFVSSVQTAEAEGPKAPGFTQFIAQVFRNVLRFGIGAVAIAWMVVSVLWLVA